MKKIIALMLSVALISPIYAAEVAQLKINIKDASRENKYFLCLYGVGCLSIHAGNRGKIFPIVPIDIGNMTKMVITDAENMAMYTQPNVDSCNVVLKSNQRLTISGQLVIKNNMPHIDHLACRVI